MVCTHIAEVVWSLSPGCLILRFVHKFSFSRGVFFQDSCDRCRFLFRYSLVRRMQRRQRPILGVFVQGVIVSLPANWVLQFLFFLSTPALFSFPPLVSASRFRLSFPPLVSASRSPSPVSVSRFRFRPCFCLLFLPLVPGSVSCRLLPPPVLASCFRPHLFLVPLGLPGYFRVNSLLSAGLPLTQRSSNLGFRISE